LNNRKAILAAAVIAVLQALRNHPNKQQLLIYDSFYPSNNNSTADLFAKMMSSPTANPEKNYLLPMPLHHKEILKIAEKLYDNLLKVAVNNTISCISNSMSLSSFNIRTIIFLLANVWILIMET